MDISAARNTVSLWLKNISGALGSIVFPAGCRLCDELLVHAALLPICELCLSSFTTIAPGSCDLCGLPATFDPEFPHAVSYCRDCQERRFAFQLARSYGLYERPLVRAILLLKYERIEPLGTWFAERLTELVAKEQERMAADVVVPVPLHRQRSRERGFNQVDVFGRPLARRLRLPYRPVLLMRSRPRPEKHLLRHDERWDAVRGAFAMGSGGRVDNLRVLLLDDVMTTGATLDACTRALREAGAKSVVGLTLARAGYPAGFSGFHGNMKDAR
jgi:competence protein ComFC